MPICTTYTTAKIIFFNDNFGKVTAGCFYCYLPYGIFVIFSSVIADFAVTFAFIALGKAMSVQVRDNSSADLYNLQHCENHFLQWRFWGSYNRRFTAPAFRFFSNGLATSCCVNLVVLEKATINFRKNFAVVDVFRKFRLWMSVRRRLPSFRLAKHRHQLLLYFGAADTVCISAVRTFRHGTFPKQSSGR